ncbi:MAG: DNA translocase FtsK 4TM domain-containing protein [Candidatus Taylorbacteria bacterium]
MAKKKDRDSEFIEKAKFWNDMHEETVQTILAIFAFMLTILSLLAAFGKAGVLGDMAYTFFTRLCGVGYFLIPVIATLIGIALLRGVEKRFRVSKTIGSLVFFLSSLGLIQIASAGHGGALGRLVAVPLIKILDVYASSILLIVLIVVSLFILFEAHFTLEQLMFWRYFRSEKSTNAKGAGVGRHDDDDGEMNDNEEAKIDQALAGAQTPAQLEAAEAIARAKKVEERARSANKTSGKAGALDFSDEDASAFASAITIPLLKPFTPPPLSLLEKDRGKPETGDIKANANIIKRTLQNFGITVEMDEISIGPSVTRYSLKPAEGVKLSRIITLNNDLSLALAAHPIRIEAPIPGKSLVGIEVPNTAKTTVGLATLLGATEYQESEKPLFVSLGKDITGRAHFCNLAKAPHMLIAGATGSGKSVSIHALITSLLYRNSPENLKFIMIDPKRVELTLYNKIPHLLTPVITDPKKAILALKWAAKEMSRRYDILEKNSARDIDSYHKNVLAPAVSKLQTESTKKRGGIISSEDASGLPETMPFIAIVIDELADIMQTYPRELEAAIVRLAQMSRAVGIHLIVSTQRPSVNVITGLIKANIPTRIALQVASQIDSRTILDQMGAEKLLGAGDMLYLGGEMSKPVRLQSAYISEGEVKAVVKFLADQYKDEILGEINLNMSEAGSGAAFSANIDLDSDSLEDQDELYESAKEAVIAAGKASTSYIQRKLGVGYSRAAKLMDILEDQGVIGPANGSKPREIMGGGSSNGPGGSDGDLGGLPGENGGETDKIAQELGL